MTGLMENIPENRDKSKEIGNTKVVGQHWLPFASRVLYSEMYQTVPQLMARASGLPAGGRFQVDAVAPSAIGDRLCSRWMKPAVILSGRGYPSGFQT
jgi:hypothetical protein